MRCCKSVGWIAVALLVSGCGGGDGLPREPVVGRVALNGEPVADGMITFEPATGGEPVASAVIQNGEYEIERVDGPIPGKHKVSIWARKPTGKKVKSPDDPDKVIDELVDVVPDQYNLRTVLTAEVEAGGDNEFSFDLKGGNTRRR